MKTVSEEITTMDDYWGVCPECHKHDGLIHIGKSHWFYCKQHKTRWCVGANLISTWRDKTIEEQRRIFDALDFGAFEIVKPVLRAAISAKRDWVLEKHMVENNE